MRALLGLVLVAGCGGSAASPAVAPASAPAAPTERGVLIEPSAAQPLPPHTTIALDPTPKTRRRAVPAETVLRAFLGWFGGLAPHDTFLRARGNDLFDQWFYYLAALGLPDHHVDAPRVSQSNTVMLATIGRLGEALCVRSVEHDLRAKVPMSERLIFAFEVPTPTTIEAFAPAFDVLHRTFLGYPAKLAPGQRIARFFALYRDVAARGGSKRLTADELGWVAVCAALVEHPEAWLY